MSELPGRDTTKPAEKQGLFAKFIIRRTDGSDAPGGKHDGCDYFVLDVDHDPHAKAALAAYAASVEATHPLLAVDMRSRYALASQDMEQRAGFVMVPVEPTSTMLCAALAATMEVGVERHVMKDAAKFDAVYRAMLAAAPPIEALEGGKTDGPAAGQQQNGPEGPPLTR